MNGEGRGDEATNRNYPSLNMRFTESTIQIRENGGKRGGPDLCNPLYLIRTDTRIERIGNTFQIGTIITCLPDLLPSIHSGMKKFSNLIP